MRKFRNRAFLALCCVIFFGADQPTRGSGITLWDAQWPDEPFGPCTENEQYNYEQLCQPAASQCDSDCWDWCNGDETYQANPWYPWVECGSSLLDCSDGSPCSAECECYFEYVPPR
jgi:hypothetical protein